MDGTMVRQAKKFDPMSLEAMALRLIALRRVAGLTTPEMCKRIGAASKGTAWTNYEVAHRRISLDHALALRIAFGVTTDWIYTGDWAGVDPDLKPKLQELLSSLGNPGPLATS